MAETQEIWKPIKGYEGLYEVSNHGRIKRLERIASGTNRKIREMIRKWEDKDYREFQKKMMADTWKRRKENGWQSWKTAR